MSSGSHVGQEDTSPDEGFGISVVANLEAAVNGEVSSWLLGLESNNITIMK